MAKKSKTQRAKASAARQARKAERDDVLENKVDAAEDESQESEKKSLFKRSDKSDKEKAESTDVKKSEKKSEDNKPKKKHFQFFRDVKAELKRVTWPTKLDVLRWSGVVVAALVFFGIFVAVLDNIIITPLLVLMSGADPATVDWGSVFSGNFSGSSADSSAASSVSSAAESASE